MKARSTKKALMMSVLSLFLCVAMLAGTTYAWFTDSVTSAGNVIKAGKLEIGMYWAEGQNAVPADAAGWNDASTGAIFDYDKWEPGYVQVRHIKIANEGSLALKYNVSIVPNGEVTKLADVIDVYYLDPAEQIADRTALDPADKIGTLTEVIAALGETANGTLEALKSDTITLAFKMQESAGNEYQGLSIGSSFSVVLVATQLASEDDSFDNQYDKDATYPEINITDAAHTGDADTVIESENNINVKVPEEAPAGNYTLESVVTDKKTDDEGNTTLAFDLTLKKDGEKVTANGTIAYTVSVDVGKNLNISKVTHKGEDVAHYYYTPDTGILTFETDSFSPFTITFADADANSVYAPATPEAAEKLEKETVVAVDENGNEYTSFTAAVQSGATKLYLKAGADLGSITHLDVANDLTIYGNGAYISGGERDLAIDTYALLTKDITVTVYNLHGVAFWGQRNTAYTANLNLYNCNDISRVYINGMSGVNNIALYNCTASLGNAEAYKDIIGDTVVYSNANGTIVIDGCTFTGIGCPVNLNHKVAGEQTVIVKNSAFVDCSTEGTAAYYAPIRLYNSVEGANQTLTVADNTFAYSEGKAPINGADVLLNAKHNGADAIGTIKAYVEASATAATGANVELAYAIYSADDLYTLAYEVNKVAEFEKNSFDGKTVKLMNDIDLGGAEWDPIGNFGNSSKQFTGIFDGQGYTISNFKITKKTPDRADKDRSPHGFFGNVNGTIKNLTIEGATLDLPKPKGATIKWAGILVGRLNGGTVENCHVVDSSILIEDWQVGGLVGQLNNGTLIGCSVENTSVTGKAAAGGLVGVLLTSGDRLIKDCAVKNVTIVQNGSFGGDYDAMFGALIGATYSGIQNVSVNGCTIEGTTLNGVACDTVCGYVEDGDKLIIDGIWATNKPVTNLAPAPYKGDLYAEGSNIVSYKDMVLSGDAYISIDNNASVAVENVKADVNGSVIVMKDYQPTIFIYGSEFTIGEGEYLIDASAIEGGVYQIFLVNVKVNGEFLTQATAAKYLNNVKWFQALQVQE